jgi:Tfp pilus assembly protein PilZ
MSQQGRRDNRVNVDWIARVGKRGIGVAKGRVQNASISGIYVETTLALSTGDHVLLELQVDIEEGSRPILCEALIARRNEDTQRRSFGYGMQFTRIDDDALQQILQLITELWSVQQPKSD